MDFIDVNVGWVVGSIGTILHTSDGGETWIAQASSTAEDLFAIDFIDANTGWAVGENGTILFTNDGGFSWNSQESGTTAILRGVAAIPEPSTALLVAFGLAALAAGRRRR